MESLLWHLTNRTAETLLILNLFHLLLAGLALLVMIHQRVNRGANSRADRLLTIGFSLLVIHFALLTLRFGVAFFLGEQLRLAGLERVSHGLLVAGVLAIVAAYIEAAGERHSKWVAGAFAGLVVTVLVDVSASASAVAITPRPHSAAMLISDAIAVLSLLVAIRALARRERVQEGHRARLLALLCLVLVFALHGAPTFLSQPVGIAIWNLEEHLMSLALFGFTWAVGERSQNLLDRVFVRLNLTFIILASLIMLITAGMEKYQYFRLAEERSVNLAEFLRGHLLYYSGKGETLEQIFNHPEVLRRVVTEFGTLPELREVNIYAKGQRAGFRYTQDWEVRETIAPDDERDASQGDGELRNSFQMIRLLIRDDDRRDRIEFIGTMDYVNEYIGKYIIFIYCAFTVMLAIGTLVIGMIVADTDRQLKRRYAELQETQQQLAQAAKLASIGELAGGMAHEINNPITSILALASHMAAGDNAGPLNSRGRKNLHLIVRQAERVANLVGGLLTFSRQSQLHISRVNVGELLETALDLVQYRMKERAIQVHQEIEPGLPAVQGDASRLTEVFVNLLSNAIDAMPNGGTLRVRVATSPAEEAVRIEVQDTGQGIAAEHLPRIFDPFFTTKAPGRGTGLGLSISHGIIKDHGGEIWACSEPGNGTTLVVSLSTGVDRYESAYSRN